MLDYETIIKVLTEKIKSLETIVYVNKYTIEDLERQLNKREQNKEV